MSLLNRKRYDARWLWDWAKSTDEWPETNPGDDQGTSVRAACDILRSPRPRAVEGRPTQGRSYKQRDKEEPAAGEGITRLPLGQDRRPRSTACSRARPTTRAGAVRILNSWGRGYPHRVWMPDETCSG